MGGQKPHLLDHGRQQPRRRDRVRLRAVDPVLPRRQARRAALGHPPAVPGARRRARRDPRPHQRQPLRHAATPTTTATSTASSASSAASAWSSSGTPRSSRRRRPRRARRRRPTLTAVSHVPPVLHEDVVPHRRVPRSRARLGLLRRAARRRRPRRVLPRARRSATRTHGARLLDGHRAARRPDAGRGARGLPGAEGLDAAPGGLRPRRHGRGSRIRTPSPSRTSPSGALQPRRATATGVLHPSARGAHLPLRARARPIRASATR